MSTRQKALINRYIAAFIVVLSSGCVVGQKINYHDTVADIAASGTKTVGTATHDQRFYVLSGDKSPNIVGLMRGGYGNPFDVTTESGLPVADDITAAVAASLTKKGFKAVTAIVLASDSIDIVMEKLKATTGENLILLTINEWKINTYANLALYYNIDLKIFDRVGNVLAESNVKGADNLGGSFNISKYAKIVAPQAFKKKIEELLNNPDVVKALQ